MKFGENVKVWDPLVRMLHWLLACSFFIAYFSEDTYIHLHASAGYTIILLLLIRITWGFVGSYHARFGNFVTSPSRALCYTIDSLRNRASRYIGHNPAAAFMIIVMLVTLTLLSVSGLAIYAIEEQAGPMATWFVGTSEWVEDITEEMHEFFANLMLGLIVVHLSGVLIESLLHRENLVRSMINGNKRL